MATTPTATAPTVTKTSKTIGICAIIVVVLVALGSFIHWASAREAAGAVKTSSSAAQPSSEPVYPIEGSRIITQDGWCESIVMGDNQRISVSLDDEDVWLDTRLNKNRVFHQASKISGFQKPNNFREDEINVLEYQIKPGTEKTTATIHYTITKKS